MNQKPIEKLTLTEIAAEIAERLRAFDESGSAKRIGAWVRVSQKRVDGDLNREHAIRYLELLRRGYRIGPGSDHAQTIYRAWDGVMREASGYVGMYGARHPDSYSREWHPTRLEAAQAYLTEQTKRLRDAQELQAAALELWQQEQRAAEDGDKSAPVRV